MIVQHVTRPESTNGTTSSPTSPLRELAALFLKLGVIGFGGPAAHIALMEEEIVRRRGWLTRGEFLDLVGAANLIPGPNSTEIAIHVGRRRAGVPGLLVAGACFILPAMLIVLACAWGYVRFGARPRAQGILYGVKPVVIAIVLQALARLAKTALKSRLLALLGVAAAAAAGLGADELLVLFSAGFGLLLFRAARQGMAGGMASLGLVPLPSGLPLAATAAPVLPFGLWPMFLFFLKVGSVLFGSGYVLLAFLRADLVERWHWLTESQLLDAIAVGQVTPGPLFTTATFIGYLLGGTPGAVLATVGIFLPAFVLVALSAPLIARLRASPLAAAFLDGVNVASLSLMGVVTWHLGRSAIHDPATAGIAIAAATLLLAFGAGSTWLVLGGAVLGLLVG